MECVPRKCFTKRKKKKISPSCLCLNSVLQCFKMHQDFKVRRPCARNDSLCFDIPYPFLKFWHVLDLWQSDGLWRCRHERLCAGKGKDQEAREPAVFRDWESGEQTEMWTREEEEERWFTCSAGGLSVSKPASSMKSQEGTGELMKWAGRPN